MCMNGAYIAIPYTCMVQYKIYMYVVSGRASCTQFTIINFIITQWINSPSGICWTSQCHKPLCRGGGGGGGAGVVESHKVVGLFS